MDVISVSEADGKAAAVLFQLIQAGRWDLSGKEADRLVEAKRWLGELCGLMAAQLRPASSAPAPAAPATSSTGFKVKAMGPLAGSPKPKKKSK